MARALTPKQEKYVQGLIAGLSQRQAYREAYPNSSKWKDANVDSRASNLLKNDKVLARYEELLAEHKDKALWTREESVETLKWLVRQSMDSIKTHDKGYVRQGASTALVSAIKELNSLEALYPDKTQNINLTGDMTVDASNPFDDISTEDIKKLIADD